MEIAQKKGMDAQRTSRAAPNRAQRRLHGKWYAQFGAVEKGSDSRSASCRSRSLRLRQADPHMRAISFGRVKVQLSAALRYAGENGPWCGPPGRKAYAVVIDGEE